MSNHPIPRRKEEDKEGNQQQRLLLHKSKEKGNARYVPMCGRSMVGDHQKRHMFSMKIRRDMFLQDQSLVLLSAISICRSGGLSATPSVFAQFVSYMKKMKITIGKIANSPTNFGHLNVRARTAFRDTVYAPYTSN